MEVDEFFSVACTIQYRGDSTFSFHNQEEMALQCEMFGRANSTNDKVRTSLPLHYDLKEH